MKNQLSSVAAQFSQEVLKRPKMQHAACRVGIWLAGIADLTSSRSVEAFAIDIQRGWSRDGVSVEGVSFRHETVKKSIEYLVDEGLLSVSNGGESRGSSSSNIYTFL